LWLKNCNEYDFLTCNFGMPADSEVIVANVQIPFSFTHGLEADLPSTQATAYFNFFE
jgi:hypothetical protein